MFYDKRLFLNISQDSQEYTCVTVSFFNKVAGIWHRKFAGNFLQFLRGPFLENTYARLLLIIGRNSSKKKTVKKKNYGKCSPFLSNSRVVLETENPSWQPEFKMLCNINCKSKWIIHLLECNLCKIQYVGKSKGSFNFHLKF